MKDEDKVKPQHPPHRRPKSDDRIKIICVLRKGGDYDEKYVRSLFNGLQRVIGHRDDWDLVCFTDFPNLNTVVSNEIELVPLLVPELKGWWSKLEVFRYLGSCIYIDLDTIMVSDFSEIFDYVRNMKDCEFMMLEDFNPQNGWASGLMAWNGDWSQILMEISEPAMEFYKWDQRYITQKLKLLEAGIESFQQHLTGIYSYKYHVLGNLPKDAKMVCFHGKPRPHQTLWLGWVKRLWVA